jgi:hypothetical protein
MTEQQSRMFALVQEWKQSDLTKSAFTTLKSLSYHQFNYWLKKYNKEHDSEESKSEVSFFTIPENSIKPKRQEVQKYADRKAMRIDLPGGISITVYKC